MMGALKNLDYILINRGLWIKLKPNRDRQCFKPLADFFIFRRTFIGDAINAQTMVRASGLGERPLKLS
jgi:hypothetical protein